MTRVLSKVIAHLLAVAASAAAVAAQGMEPPVVPPGALPAVVIDSATGSAIARARGLANAGQDTLARALLDSIVARQQSGSDEFAEAVYWRAVLADRAADAERDWKRLTIEAPLSPRMPDALLWLAELEMVRGHAGLARGYLDRLLRENAGSPQRHKATVWIARTYFDERDYTRACDAVRAMQSAGLPEGELRLQGDDMLNRCTAIAAAAAAEASAAAGTTAPSSATTSTPAGSGATPPTGATAAAAKGGKATAGAPAASAGVRYSVQLAAFNTRAEATRLVKQMAARKVTARIDGDRKPFRVRTGRYTSESAAKSALAALTKRGIKGIVVESTR